MLKPNKQQVPAIAKLMEEKGVKFPDEDMELPDKKLLRVDEVATYFDVSKQAIYLWIDHGLLEAEKYHGTIRVPRKSVMVFRLASRLKKLEE